MAILYGTQSNGETLPVLVDQYGNLLAKGIDGATGPEGPQGPQGPQGPSGKDGDGQPVVTSFTPYFEIMSGGSAIIEYENQDGVIFQWGNYVQCTGSLKTTNVLITDPRGTIGVGGFPSIHPAQSKSVLRKCAATLTFSGFKTNFLVAPTLSGVGNSIDLRYRVSDNTQAKLPTSQFNEGDKSIPNTYTFFVYGFLMGSDIIAKREKIFDALSERIRPNS
jgi:hypothetical protein